MSNQISLTNDELAAFGVSKVVSDNGKEYFEVPCAICGRKTRVHKFEPTRAYKCAICRGTYEEKRRKNREAAQKKYEQRMAKDLGVDYAHYHRFERAAKKFGPKHLFAIQQAETVMNKFESVPEVIACIELLYIGARVIPHQRVGSYVVDFCLPDEKLIVEIDGSIYHANKDKEYKRDYALKNLLGSNWDIKHIPADAVTEDSKAFRKAMRKLLDDRRFELCVK